MKKDGDNYPLLIRSVINIEKIAEAEYPSIRIRVEGKDSTHIDKVAVWDGEKSALDFFKEEVGEANVVGSSSGYGFMVTSLFDEAGISGEGYSTNWGLYVDNGSGINSASVGISTLDLSNVKELLFHYKATENGTYADLTYIPRVEIDGQILTVNKEVITYAEDWSKTVSNEVFAGAEIQINGKDYVSDASGEIDLSHLKAGNLDVKVKKDGDNYPLLIRSEFSITKVSGLSSDYSNISSAISGLNEFYNLNTSYSWRQAVGKVHSSVSVSTDIYDSIESKYNLATGDSSSAYAGNIFGILASGRDPYDYMGVDHVKRLVDIQNDEGKFIIGQYDDYSSTMAYVLLALDAVNATYEKTKAINELLSGQGENGMISDVDTTAMVLSALSNHTDITGVTEAIDKGFTYIKSQQQDNGGFISWGADSPYTAITVINALVANNKDVFSSEWMKNGKTTIDALMGFKEGNHFENTSDYGTEINSVSEQAYIALSGVMKKELAYKVLSINKENADRPAVLPSVFEIERVSSGVYKNGEGARVEVEFTNKSLINQDVMMVIGLYNETSNELVNYSYCFDTVNKGASNKFGSGMLIPESGNYKIKVFIWDSFESQKIILITPFEISVEQ